MEGESSINEIEVESHIMYMYMSSYIAPFYPLNSFESRLKTVINNACETRNIVDRWCLLNGPVHP